MALVFIWLTAASDIVLPTRTLDDSSDEPGASEPEYRVGYC